MSSQSLAKGQNAPLSTSSVVVTVDVAAPADLSALLVTAAGKVRTDADFVFYNAPDGPGVHLVQSPWRLQIDLAAVPADIEAVRAVVTLDADGAQFGPMLPPLARVCDESGAELFTYAVEGLGTESVLIALELYRRAGSWKVRAVGQGYAGGFADLVTDHGVSVDDQPPATPTPPPAPAAPTEVQLTKNKPVSLSKGQKVTLRKDGGTALTLVRMGLGWDPIRKRSVFGNREAEIDLDAAALLLADSSVVDITFYNQLTSKDGSVVHQGDNRTGAGDGDDEVLVVDLTRVPVHVTSIVFVVTSYEGQTFQQVDNAFCRLVDHTTGTELARYTLSGGEAATAMIMARVYRKGSDWKLEAVGSAMQARNPLQAVEQVSRYVATASR
ncbi:MAG: TerD family protein [Mycobacteriaceae bacterium]